MNREQRRLLARLQDKKQPTHDEIETIQNLLSGSYSTPSDVVPKRVRMLAEGVAIVKRARGARG